VQAAPTRVAVALSSVAAERRRGDAQSAAGDPGAAPKGRGDVAADDAVGHGHGGAREVKPGPVVRLVAGESRRRHGQLPVGHVQPAAHAQRGRVVDHRHVEQGDITSGNVEPPSVYGGSPVRHGHVLNAHLAALDDEDVH